MKPTISIALITVGLTFPALATGVPAQAEVIAVPCYSGRPGRWLVSEVPKGVEKFMILKVNKMLPRDIPSHPAYDPEHPGLYEYAMCAIVPHAS